MLIGSLTYHKEAVLIEFCIKIQLTGIFDTSTLMLIGSLTYHKEAVLIEFYIKIQLTDNLMHQPLC